MVKGLGSILANLAAREQADRLADGEAVKCPICGVEMEAGLRWFCYSADPDAGDPCILSPAFKDVEQAYYDNGGKYDDWQEGQVLAAVVVNGQPVVELRVMRGGYGRSNLRVSNWGGNRVAIMTVPALIQRFGWTWQDWIPDKYTK